MSDRQEVLGFWFSSRISKHWFDSTPELDAEIRARFEPIWRQARRGELDGWAETPEGALALIIILDQFPLNMYRGQAEAFSTEQKAVATTKLAVERGFHAELPEDRRLFLFLPLMHSENLDDQDLSVKLFLAAGMNPHWPEHHRSLVRRFGRFPHRNAILDRESTPDELAYLASDEAFKG